MSEIFESWLPLLRELSLEEHADEISSTLKLFPQNFKNADFVSLPAKCWPGKLRASMIRKLQGALKLEAATEAENSSLKRIKGNDNGTADPAGTADKRRKIGSKEESFFEAVDNFSPDQALAAISDASSKSKTKTTYAPAIRRYNEMCSRKGLIPFPLSIDKLLTYAGYMKLQEDKYLSPSVDLSAVVAENTRLGHQALPKDDRINKAHKALSEGLKEEEQAEPFRRELLKLMYETARTNIDYDLVLMLLAAVYCLARSTCFAEIEPKDIRDTDGDGVSVTLKNLKGRNREKSVDPHYERVPGLGSWSNPVLGQLLLCPVEVFRRLRSRASGNTASNIPKEKFQRTLNHLLERAKIDNRVVGRTRHLYTHHSTRVSGTCYLLRCGLLPLVISAIADWSSDMVCKYGRKILLNPEAVEAIKFYNPVSMKSSYGAVGNGLALENSSNR